MMYLTLYSFVVSYFCLVELMIVLVRARGLWRSSTQAILYSLEPYFSASGLHFHQKSCKEQKVHSILFPKRSKNLACREATTSALFTKRNVIFTYFTILIAKYSLAMYFAKSIGKTSLCIQYCLVL